MAVNEGRTLVIERSTRTRATGCHIPVKIKLAMRLRWLYGASYLDQCARLRKVPCVSSEGSTCAPSTYGCVLATGRRVS
jgi:hypothetical protein